MMLQDQREKLHEPVLVSELLSLFSEEAPPQEILDCSFGRGGHSRALLSRFPQARVTGLDWDRQAIEYGSSLREAKEGKIKLLKRNFYEFASSSKKRETYNMIVMDLGPSSPQLDDGERGFSFYQDGPLDMRMDRERKLKAGDIINSWSREELIRLFQSFGEIKNPRRTVEAIIKQRGEKKFERTLELSRLIQKRNSRNNRRKHPATAWFLALRIAVNQELEGLKACLPEFPPLLKERGLLAVISFHSLEDRIVKRAFRQLAGEGKGRLWNKKAIRPGLEEKKQNPRSRSAKMRVFQKMPA